MPIRNIIFDNSSALDLPIDEIFNGGITDGFITVFASGRLNSQLKDCAFKLQINNKETGEYPQSRVDIIQKIPNTEIRVDGIVLGANGGKQNADFFIELRVSVLPMHQQISAVGTISFASADPVNNLIFHFSGSLNDNGPLRHVKIFSENGSISGRGEVSF